MYKIGELSRLSRIPVKTLRFYDAEGILVQMRLSSTRVRSTCLCSGRAGITPMAGSNRSGMCLCGNFFKTNE